MVYFFVYFINLNKLILITYSYMSPINKTSQKLIIFTIGILISYGISSLITERLYSHAYPSNVKGTNGKYSNDVYKCPTVIVWVSSLMCGIFGLLKTKFFERPNQISLRQQATLGMLFTLNYLPANYALLFIPYHIQVIAKNTRYIFVIIVGVFFSRVRKGQVLKLGVSKLFIGMLITSGAIIFTLFRADSHGQKDVDHLDDQWKGYLLILVSIVADAFFSDSQAYSKVTFKPTANHLFTAANLFSFFFVFTIAVVTGELVPSIKFLIQHPSAIIDVCAICVLQLIGQNCIYLVVANFKQHIYPLISTVRKIITIVLSILVYGHAVTTHQLFAMVLVFGGMAYEFVDEVGSQQKHQKHKKHKEQQEQKLKKQLQHKKQ